MQIIVKQDRKHIRSIMEFRDLLQRSKGNLKLSSLSYSPLDKDTWELKLTVDHKFIKDLDTNSFEEKYEDD